MKLIQEENAIIKKEAAENNTDAHYEEALAPSMFQKIITGAFAQL